MRGRQPTPRLFAVSLSVAIVLAGCVQPAGYRVQEDVRGIRLSGYTDQKVGENEHSVVAIGLAGAVFAKRTTNERIAQLTLLRAARLTLEQGHRRFVIIHGTSSRQRIGTAHIVAIPGATVPIVVRSDSDARTRPMAILIIRLMNDDEAPPDAFDAKAIEAALAPVFE